MIGIPSHPQTGGLCLGGVSGQTTYDLGVINIRRGNDYSAERVPDREESQRRSGCGHQPAYRPFQPNGAPSPPVKGSCMNPRCKVLLGLVLLVSLAACSHPLYVFPNLPRNLPSGSVNLLTDPSFESPVGICSFRCKTTSTWSIEYSTPKGPLAFRSRTGAVTGSHAETLIYNGQTADNGINKEIELYQSVAGPATTAGHRLTFTAWISGTCVKCAPFIGIEAFNKVSTYLGESDQYFGPPATPQPVQVSYVLPSGTVRVAAYLQVPELYSISKFNLSVDDTSLTAARRASIVRFRPNTVYLSTQVPDLGLGRGRLATVLGPRDQVVGHLALDHPRVVAQTSCRERLEERFRHSPAMGIVKYLRGKNPGAMPQCGAPPGEPA
jgi:hypothetical protein